MIGYIWPNYSIFMVSDINIKELSYFTLHKSNEPFLWIDESGTIKHINTALETLFGFSEDEITGRKIYDFHPDENAETWKEAWEDLKVNKKHVFDKKQPTKAGNILHVEITRNYIEFGGKEYTVSSVKDKTEEYAVCDRLMENERKLSTLMGNLPGMVYRCLFEKKWTMEFISNGCENLTGYKPNELLHNSIVSYQDLIEEKDREKVWRVVKNGIDNHTSFQVQYRIKTAQQKMKWVWEQGIGICDEYNKTIAIEGFITDISHIKKTEEKLIEKERQVRELKDQLQEESIYLKEEIKLYANFEEIITTSKIFRKTLKSIEQVAGTDSTVLIFGETGTGKELIARAIHNNSNRSNRALIKVNCAALAPDIVESELFGHLKGAFTGAYSDKKGRFEIANEGTLFLDEIGELPTNLQVKLLRVLQEGEFERLGDTKTIKTDVRIITATNRNLEKAVDNGDFREDLFYRLNVFPVHVPPLRERKEDIPLLVNHFIKKYTTKTGKKITETSEKVINHLIEYDWPGNVRELENIIERAVIICSGNRLTYGTWLPNKKKNVNKDIPTLEENERQLILKAIKETKGRISGENGAAKLLNIKRTTLEARMKKLGISKP